MISVSLYQRGDDVGYAYRGRVLHNGAWLRIGAEWRFMCRLSENDLDSAIDLLREDDAESFMQHVEALFAERDEKRAKKDAIVADAMRQISEIREGQACTVQGPRDRIRFIRGVHGLCVCFYKQGGYVERALPISEMEAEALIRGSKKLMYLKGTSRARLVDVK